MEMITRIANVNTVKHPTSKTDFSALDRARMANTELQKRLVAATRAADESMSAVKVTTEQLNCARAELSDARAVIFDLQRQIAKLTEDLALKTSKKTKKEKNNSIDRQDEDLLDIVKAE